MNPPLDYDYFIGCEYYKLGVHGLLYRWNVDGKWVNSTRYISELKKRNTYAPDKSFFTYGA